VSTVEIRVPNIGTFAGVPVVEVHVGPGSEVQPEDPLITLESDKASLEVPAPQAGSVRELAVRPGDRVSEGDLILVLDTQVAAGVPPKERITEDAAPAVAHAGGPDYGSPSGVYNTIEVRVPDIGDFDGVQIVDLHVSAGSEIKAEDPIITLETDKASMEVPAPTGGTVDEMKVHPGDRVSQGDLILLLRVGVAPPVSTASVTLPPAQAPSRKPPTSGRADLTTEVLVLGAGPGGYTAAFRAADLGKQVVLVDRRPTLGGVCLNIGCIPSKALLHAARVLAETRDMSQHGLSFGEPQLDLDRLRAWKQNVVARLTTGLAGLARQRHITVLQGSGRFASSNELEVETADRGRVVARFEQAIVACGSEPVTLPFVPHQDPRVLDSTGALALQDVPRRLLVLGAGIIGLEMATVYHELGAEITVAELMDQIIPGADLDIVSPLMKRIERRYANIFLKTKVTAVEARPDGLVVHFDGPTAPATDTFDKLLVAVGRKPNGRLIGAENAGVAVDERGFIPTDRQMRTNVPTIFAIGDVVGQPMLAHKAIHEGRVAAEVAAGMNSSFDARVIPSVAYTDPEVAWVGLSETEARANGIKFGKGGFPWAASGRSLSLGRDEGVTKILFNPESHQVLGAGIVGPGAGELISELALAIEMGADADDVGLTIHPHPTLSETIGMAAEAFEGTITDLYLPKSGLAREAVHTR
jgi:dihydrolipoamide dehydrogenase